MYSPGLWSVWKCSRFPFTFLLTFACHRLSLRFLFLLADNLRHDAFPTKAYQASILFARNSSSPFRHAFLIFLTMFSSPSFITSSSLLI